MKITLRIVFADGTTKDIVCSAVDLVAFEEKYNKSIAELENPRMGWLLWLAWHSENRRKETEDDFDTWLEKIESVGQTTDPKATAESKA